MIYLSLQEFKQTYSHTSITCISVSIKSGQHIYSYASCRDVSLSELVSLSRVTCSLAMNVITLDCL